MATYGHNKREEIVVARLRIGPTGLTHEFLMPRQDEPTRETCNTEKTEKH